MTTTVNLSLTDRMTIARMIADSTHGERGTYEIERKFGAYNPNDHENKPPCTRNDRDSNQ